MRKLLIIITLFASSFFLFNGNVKAAEIWKFDDYSLVSSDIFLIVKNKAEELLTTIDYDNYMISYSSSLSTYRVSFFDEPSLSFKSTYNSGYSYAIYFSSLGFYSFDESTSELVLINNYTSSVTQLIKSYYFLYSTVDVLFVHDSLVGYFNYITPDFSRLYSSSSDDNTIIPLLYDICVDSGNCSSVEEENLHQEEIDKLSNFYSLVIDKLSYLSEAIVSNYILLSIIVIFLLIFIFKLIFRRYL